MNDQVKGILLLLVTVFVFSIGDAVGKLIAEASGGLMASWGRFVFALAALMMMVGVLIIALSLRTIVISIR